MVAVAGCYDPHARLGAPCDDDSRCPAGQPCIRGTCGGRDEPVDGTVSNEGDATVTVDAPVELGPWTMVTKLTLPGVLPGDIDDPTLTADLREMYFNLDDRIFVTTRDLPTDPWRTPSVVSDFGSSTLTTPEISGDGLTLYFSSTRTGGLGLLDIWISRRTARDKPWGAATNVTILNTPYTDTGGAASADDRVIVFSRVLPNGNDTSDIWTSTRANPSDNWEQPVAIPSINTPTFEDRSAMLAPDGLAVYFESSRAGAPDLYVARRPIAGVPFNPPQPIAELNTASADEDPWISPDGRHLFFSSQRSGTRELYEATR